MTFEGDASGLSVADLIRGCPARNRRVLVDAYTLHVLSDRFRWHPRSLVSPSVWLEARATRRMLTGLERQGVAVRFGSPAGPFFRRLPARNHKKLVTIDGQVAYFGGLNFSDHNFGWHDLMLRVEDAHVAAFLEEDFLSTWAGREHAGSLRLPGLTIHALDGRRNEAAFREILDMLAQAQEEIFLECPYVTDPFSQELERAAWRGVRVTVVTSERHNFPLVRQALAHVAARSPLELRLYPDRMTHMRALLIDGRALVMGSANFDFWSYRCQQEYVAVVTEPGTVAAFRQRVAEPDLACSKPSPRPDDGRGSRGVEARLAGLALIASLCARARD